jgi:DNA-directed RNA polymerase specialized sigma24 family protein
VQASKNAKTQANLTAQMDAGVADETALPRDHVVRACDCDQKPCLEQRAQLEALSHAIGELTDRQREVFVAVALNEVEIDVLAAKLGTKRNAIYKNLFDARRRLRASMAAAGHPVSDTCACEIAASGNGRLAAHAATSAE